MSLGEATFDTAGDKRGLGAEGVTDEEGVGLAGLRGIREDGLTEEEGVGCVVCLGEEGEVNDCVGEGDLGIRDWISRGSISFDCHKRNRSGLS